MRLLAALTAILVSVLALAGCGFQRAGPLKDTLRINLGSEPPSLDWHIGTDNTSLAALTNMMMGLVQFRDDLSCAPGCAESWDVKDGGKKYVFHLRKNAKWSDGKPVVSEDFRYSWLRLLNPATAASYAFFLYDVENAFEYNTGNITDPRLVGLDCPDEHTLVVKLKKPASYFIHLTTMCCTYPLRKDILEKYGNRWTEPENIVTNGPFKMKSWNHEYKLELEADPLYFEGKPKVKLVQLFMIPEQATAFALYENDQLDYIDNHSFPTPEVLHNASNPEYENIPLLKTHYIGFNVTKKPFDDKKVRLAISLAVDRSIFPKILRRKEQPAFTFIPEKLSGYVAEDPPQFDPVAAKKLLAEAGYPEGKGFPPVEVLYPSREDAKLIMETIQDQLKRNLNLHVDLSNQEFKVYMNALHRDPPPIFLANWGADFPDPETFAAVFVSHDANNHTLWTNSRYDELVLRAEEESDMQKRLDAYRKADHLLCKEEAAVACLFNATENIMCKPWIHGVKTNRIDLLFFKDASVDNDWLSRRD